jgi:hypothetical protein
VKIFFASLCDFFGKNLENVLIIVKSFFFQKKIVTFGLKKGKKKSFGKVIKAGITWTWC